MSATRNVQGRSRLGMGSRVNQAVGPFIPSQVSGNVALSCRHRGCNRVPCLCLPCAEVVYNSELPAQICNKGTTSSLRDLACGCEVPVLVYADQCTVSRYCNVALLVQSGGACCSAQPRTRTWRRFDILRMTHQAVDCCMS
jgi:hypothetical protein